jgi:hypothetical protein
MKKRVTLLASLLAIVFILTACNEPLILPAQLKSTPELYFGQRIKVCGNVVATSITPDPNTKTGGVYNIENPVGSGNYITVSTLDLPSPDDGYISVVGKLQQIGVPPTQVIFENSRGKGKLTSGNVVVPSGISDPMVMMLIVVGAFLFILAIVLIVVLVSSGKPQPAQVPMPQPDSFPMPPPRPVHVEPEYTPASETAPTQTFDRRYEGLVDDETKVVSTAFSWLLVDSGAFKGRKYDIDKGTIRLGRGPRNNDIAFDDDKMSREHSVIRSRDGEFFISDRGSSNGTWVNNQKISGEHQLKDGDIITAGETKLIFKMHKRT